MRNVPADYFGAKQISSLQNSSSRSGKNTGGNMTSDEKFKKIEQWQENWRQYELEKANIIAMELDPVEYERKIRELLERLGF